MPDVHEKQMMIVWVKASGGDAEKLSQEQVSFLSAYKPTNIFLSYSEQPASLKTLTALMSGSGVKYLERSTPIQSHCFSDPSDVLKSDPIRQYTENFNEENLRILVQDFYYTKKSGASPLLSISGTLMTVLAGVRNDITKTIRIAGEVPQAFKKTVFFYCAEGLFAEAMPMFMQNALEIKDNNARLKDDYTGPMPDGSLYIIKCMDILKPDPLFELSASNFTCINHNKFLLSELVKGAEFHSAVYRYNVGGY